MKIKIIMLLLGSAALFTSFQGKTPTASKIQKGMIKVTILYPNAEGKTFDMDYYANKHMPMVVGLFGDPCKGYEIDKGIAAGRPGETLPYLAIGYFFFEKLSEYEQAFGANAEKILGDIPNYTNVQPVVLISEVVR